MREHKFRAWSTKHKRWVIPATAVDGENSTLTIQSLDKSDVVCEYTGLKDQDDTEICEGDIVKGYDDLAVIKYDDHHEAGGKFYPDFAEGKGQGWDWWSDKERWYYFEVIGNIYENPELLK